MLSQEEHSRVATFAPLGLLAVTSQGVSQCGSGAAVFILTKPTDLATMEPHILLRSPPRSSDLRQAPAGQARHVTHTPTTRSQRRHSDAVTTRAGSGRCAARDGRPVNETKARTRRRRRRQMVVCHPPVSRRLRDNTCGTVSEKSNRFRPRQRKTPARQEPLITASGRNSG
ncbi:hypothetical protein LSAT2_010192, partial [Lamellibrachia satsuma]